MLVPSVCADIDTFVGHIAIAGEKGSSATRWLTASSTNSVLCFLCKGHPMCIPVPFQIPHTSRHPVSVQSQGVLLCPAGLECWAFGTGE